MKSSNSLQFGSKSAVQILLGMLASGGQQKGAINDIFARISLHVTRVSSNFQRIHVGLYRAESLMDETIPVQEVYNRVSPTPREFSVVREDAKNKCISSSVSRRPTAQLLHAHVFDGIHLHSFDGICLQRHGDDTIRVLSVHTGLLVAMIYL